MKSKRAHEGVILIDHRASPGISQEFIAANNLDAPAVGEGQCFESALLECHSCGTDIILNPNRSRPREWCMEHDAYLCDRCAILRRVTGSCTPMWKKIEAIFKRLSSP